MIRRVNVHLTLMLRNTAGSNNHSKSWTFLTKTNFQNSVVERLHLCRNCSTNNCNKFDLDTESVYENVNFEEITNGDPDLMNKLKVIMFQTEKYRRDGSFIPKKITSSDLKYLLELPDSSARLKHLFSLAVIEFKQEYRKKKRIRRKERNFEKSKSLNIPNHITYGFGKNTLFRRIETDAFENLLNCKCYTAQLFSNNIVFDINYEKYMTDKEKKECARHLLYSSALNLDHINPFNVHFCNFPAEGKMRECMEAVNVRKVFKTVQVHEESYLEIFDPKNLVYLSPHAEQELHDYNPDDVYIIGAYVDKNTNIPVSLEKAKAEEIRSVKLPLDSYLKWKQGGKMLPINIVLGIMLDLNYYRDMRKALLKQMPPRNYYSDDELQKLRDRNNQKNTNNYSKHKTKSQVSEDEKSDDNFEGSELCIEKC